METAALRTWGLAASAAALGVALTLAALGGCGDRAGAPVPVATPPSVDTPPTPTAEANDDPPLTGDAAPASAPLRPPSGGGEARPSFVVHFADNHPLGRAQDLYASGRAAEAMRAAEASVRARRDLRGLCFDRFAVGGDVVLIACGGVDDEAAFRARWLAAFDAMNGVEYADANAVGVPEAPRAP